VQRYGKFQYPPNFSATFLQKTSPSNAKIDLYQRKAVKGGGIETTKQEFHLEEGA